MANKKKSQSPQAKSMKKKASHVGAYGYKGFSISPVTDPKTRAITAWRVTGHGDFATTEQAENYVDQRIEQIERDVQGRV
jgi:hypothetical protein